MPTTSVLYNTWSARTSRPEYALHTRQEATKTNGTTLTKFRVKSDLKTAWIYQKKKKKKTEKRKKNRKQMKKNTVKNEFLKKKLKL